MRYGSNKKREFDMKSRLTGCLIGLTTALMLMVGDNAWAASFVIGMHNTMVFQDAEVLVDHDGSGGVSAGDTVWGVLEVQLIKPTRDREQIGGDFWIMGGDRGGPDEISGYFAADVVDVKPIYGRSAALITYGPPADDPNGILESDEVIRFYSDYRTINYDVSSQSLGLASATDGRHIWSIGLSPTTGEDGVNGYWYSLLPLHAAEPGMGYIGPQYMCLPSAEGYWFRAGFGTHDNREVQPVELWSNAELFRVHPVTDREHFHFVSTEPAVVTPIGPSFPLLISGLLMLAGWRRFTAR